MRDTTPELSDFHSAIVAALDPIQRLRAALGASDLVRRLALTRLRKLHPELTERELVVLLVRERFPEIGLPAQRP